MVPQILRDYVVEKLIAEELSAKLDDILIGVVHNPDLFITWVELNLEAWFVVLGAETGQVIVCKDKPRDVALYLLEEVKLRFPKEIERVKRLTFAAMR